MNIDNPYFVGMVTQIYPTELQWNKANSTDTAAALLDWHYLISDGFVSFTFYDNAMLLFLNIVNSRVGMATFLKPLLWFLSLHGLPDSLVIWLTSMLVTKL